MVGEFYQTIDSKGRTLVPVKLREGLGQHFWITRGLDGCLNAYPDVEWDIFQGKLKALPMTNPDARKLVRFFLAGAMEVDVDKQGRFSMKEALQSYAAITSELVYAGMGDRVEIWSKERYESDATYDDINDVAAQVEAMGLMI